MKKFISATLSVSFFFILSASASEAVDKKEIKLPKEFNSTQKIITEAECKKYLGEDNYKFIVEVYGENTAAIVKM